MQEIYEYRRQGLSLSAMSRLTGYDRKTIRSYLNRGRLTAGVAVLETGVVACPDSDEPERTPAGPGLGAAPIPVYGPRAPRGCKLDPFKPYLQERMRAGVWNCAVLLRELRERGYEGGHTVLRAYVSPFRETARTLAVRRFETPPGQQAQVDWGDLGTVDDGSGQRTRLSLFAMTLGHSRALFTEVALDQKLATFLRLHEAAFAALGGVPQEILYDRCKTVVLKELLLDPELDGRGEVRWQTAFLDFARYWGFTPRLCRAYRPQTKGKIESGVKFVRRNFLPGLRCLDEAGQPGLRVGSVAEVSQELGVWLWEVANRRRHGTTHLLVNQALDQERPHLQPVLGRPSYPLPDELWERRVARDAFISFDGSRYSVPWRLAGAAVGVCQVAGLLEIRHEGEVVARHPLATFKHQIVQQADHFQGLGQASLGQASPGQASLGQASPVSLSGKERIHLRALDSVEVPVVESRSLQCYEDPLWMGDLRAQEPRGFEHRFQREVLHG